MLKPIILIAVTLLAVILGIIFFFKITLIVLVVSMCVLLFLFGKAPLVQYRNNAKIKSIKPKTEKSSDEDQLTA